MKTFNEIIDILRTAYEEDTQQLDEDLEYSIESISQLDCGKAELVDSYGGSGYGDDYWKVIYFPDSNIYIRLTGFYQSYNGVEWDSFSRNFKQVTPKEKTIKVYENI